MNRMMSLRAGKRFARIIAIVIFTVLLTFPLFIANSFCYGSDAIASTDVSGAISSDTTWTLANSPYIVTGTITVNSGVRLTIEPGVQVKFNNVYRSLQVNGELIARGTSGNPIIFTSNQPTPAPGNWQNIQFNDSAVDTTYDGDDNYTGGCIMQYCRVEYGGGNYTDAIKVSSASILIDHCVVNNNACTGIFGYFSNLKITNSTVVNNSYSYQYGGIFIYYGAVTISNSTISNNRGQYYGGISAAYATQVTITGNIISGNRGQACGGVNAQDCGTVIISNNTITNNSATGGYGGGGISVSGGTVAISGNMIANNSAGYGGGIEFWYAAGSITNNTIVANSADRAGGIYVFPQQNNPPVINYNSINNVQGTTLYDIYVYGGYYTTIDATNNWWGTTDEAIIRQHIWDRDDEWSLGKVNFSPYLINPGGATVQLVPTSAFVAVDGTCDIEVWVKGVPTGTYPPNAGLGGYNFHVDFDNTKVTLSSVLGGTAAGFTGAPTAGPADFPGNVDFVAYQTTIPGPTGDLMVARLRFTGVDVGTTTLTLTINSLTDPELTDILASAINGQITVGVGPAAIFSADATTSNTGSLEVNFSDSSTGPPTGWAWDFNNDGTVDSTAQNPKYTYPAPGNYTVKLTVTNPTGSDDETKTNYITVYAPPVANFSTSLTAGTAPLTVNFTDTSTGNIVSYAWDINNNGTVDYATKNCTHTYSTPGNYTVKLTVTNPAGTDDEVKTAYITVYAVPVANFTADNTTSNTGSLTVNFTDASTGPPTIWAWDFDNSGGTPDSTLQNPSHIYTAPGNYTVKLTVNNPAGSNYLVKTNYITVYAAPVANFSASVTSGASPLSVNFTDTSTGNIVSRAWDFNNDGTTDSNDQNPSYTYTAPGKYTVRLSVNNPAGSNYLVKTDYITVYAEPVAAFSGTPTTSNTGTAMVNFTDSSTGPPTGWAWDFDNDGAVDSTAQNPSYTYSAPGNYTVKLTVTNPAGSNYLVKTNYITVYASPVANFSASATSGNAPLTVNFTDTSTGNIVSRAWDFDNNGTTDSTSQNPSYTYTSGGTYTVKLTVTNPAGTDDEIKTGYITVISFVANIDLVQTKYDNTANPADPLNGIIMLEVKITRTYNPVTGVDVNISGGLGAYDGVATFNSTGVTMVNIVGVAPFTPAVINVILSDQATFNATQTGSASQAPITVARLVPRLKGSCNIDDKYNIVLHFNNLVAMDLTEFQESATKTLTFWRGDATNDGSKVSIADALLIAKYLAKLNVLSDLNALNAASIYPDGANGDKITIADALGLAQKLALRRDAYFNLITTPP